MTRLKASETRIPPDTFNRVAYKGERIRVERRGGASVVLISQEDADLLEELEDRYWAETADKALAAMTTEGERPVPLEELKKKLAP